MNFIKALGPFRIFLVVCSAILMGFAMFATRWLDSIVESDKFLLYISASLMPIFFFLLLFDMLMNRVQMVDKEGEERDNFRCFIRLEFIVVVLLSASWTPFFMALLG